MEKAMDMQRVSELVTQVLDEAGGKLSADKLWERLLLSVSSMREATYCRWAIAQLQGTIYECVLCSCCGSEVLQLL
jgi:hypothetical protein